MKKESIPNLYSEWETITQEEVKTALIKKEGRYEYRITFSVMESLKI